ncbi:MAG: sortase [Candidatus Heimdallarchaeaceae archaeon]
MFSPSIKYCLSNLGIGNFFPVDEVEIDKLENKEIIPEEFQETKEDELIISKIGVKIPVVEGEDESALEEGAWRLPESSTPDQGSNTVLSAHRYKYRPPHEETFYLLDKLKEGDTFLVFWQGKEYNYRVVSSFIVMPDNLEVIEPTIIPTVTLITCYPLFSNEKRLIVKGEIITDE